MKVWLPNNLPCSCNDRFYNSPVIKQYAPIKINHSNFFSLSSFVRLASLVLVLFFLVSELYLGLSFMTTSAPTYRVAV